MSDRSASLPRDRSFLYSYLIRYSALATGTLGALTAVQTLAAGHRLTLDARVPAVLVAALLLWRRAPFIVVVIAAAVTAAGLRLIFGA